jgi:hypothetical protein
MYVEFETKPENGFIKIPDDHINLNSKNVKVILICNEQTDENDDIDNFFNNYAIDLNSFKFNREEANER